MIKVESYKCICGSVLTHANPSNIHKHERGLKHHVLLKDGTIDKYIEICADKVMLGHRKSTLIPFPLNSAGYHLITRQLQELERSILEQENYYFKQK